jgi:hypothetical protein
MLEWVVFNWVVARALLRVCIIFLIKYLDVVSMLYKRKKRI